MHILMVALEPPFPTTNGHRIRRAELLRALASEGHDVTFVSFADPRETHLAAPALKLACRAFEFVPQTLAKTEEWRGIASRLLALASPMPYAVRRRISDEMKLCLARHTARRTFDAVLCDEIYSTTNLPALAGPAIVDTLHIAFVMLERYAAHERNPARRAYARLEAEKMRRWELGACARASGLIACSEPEKTQYQRLCPGVPVALVPNTVDVDRFEPAPDPGGATVLFTGGMDWQPNRDAVEFFATAILPEIRRRVPETRFRIAGRGPSDRVRRRFAPFGAIEFTGTVPDMRPELARATVCVVPLRIGSGTRLKILEAAAMARPIVSTTLGAEGLSFTPGEEIALADEPRAFAEAVVDLLGAPARRRDLGASARERVAAQYGLPALRRSVRHALRELTGVRDVPEGVRA